MNTLIDTTFSGKDISSAASVYEYTATANGMYSFQVRLAAVAGNGDYIVYLTLNDGDAQTDDPMEPKTTATLASGETACWFQTLKIPLISGDVVNIFITGQAGDTNESGSIRIFSENYAIAGDQMDLVNAPNATAITAIQSGLAQTGADSDTLETLSDQIDVIDAAVWTYTSRTLTSAAGSAGSTTDGADLTLTNKVTFDATVTGLTIPATWSKMFVTAKQNEDEDDSEAILQILVTNPGDSDDDGIQYVNKAAASATQQGYGSLTVNQSAGTVAIAVADDMVFTFFDTFTYDVKCLLSDGTSQKLAASANFVIQRTETQTV